MITVGSLAELTRGTSARRLTFGQIGRFKVDRAQFRRAICGWEGTLAGVHWTDSRLRLGCLLNWANVLAQPAFGTERGELLEARERLNSCIVLRRYQKELLQTFPIRRFLQ